MKKAIGELKFPFADNQTNATEGSSPDKMATQFMETEIEEIEEPEENWKNKNDHGTSQSIVTLQTSKPKSSRSKFSVLTAQNITICQSVPILANGFTGDGLQTINTCAFDCIFSTFACLYSDYSKFQAVVNDHESSSEFCAFIRKVMIRKKVCRETYIERNKTLYGLAGQTGKITKLTSLNCESGFGGIFSKMCNENEVLASSIMLRVCGDCGFKSRLVRPLFPVAVQNLDLGNLQTYISDPTLQQELCRECGNICNVEHQFSPVLALEVEPITSATKIYEVGELTPQIEVNKKTWRLCGIVEGRGRHFICHMLRKNNEWETYDDLAANVEKLDTSRKFAIFMMFFLCSGNSFITHFLYILRLAMVFFSLKLQITRKILLNLCPPPRRPPTRRPLTQRSPTQKPLTQLPIRKMA